MSSLTSKRHAITPDLLVVALSTGRIALYTLCLQDATKPQLSHLGNYEQTAESTLILSVAVEATASPFIATLSTGEASIFDIGDGVLSTLHTWNAHSLEAWCSAWKTPDSVMTGGDDALLKIWDLRDLKIPKAVCKTYLIFPSQC